MGAPELRGQLQHCCSPPFLLTPSGVLNEPKKSSYEVRLHIRGVRIRDGDSLLRVAADAGCGSECRTNTAADFHVSRCAECSAREPEPSRRPVGALPEEGGIPAR